MRMEQMDAPLMQGRLVRGFGGFYVAVDGQGREHILRCKKKFRRMRLSPLVGDEITFTPGENEEHGWLEDILPRKTECLRPPVANVSLLLIVLAPTPAPDLLLVDRMMIRARQQGMKLALVVNKCDLDESLAEELRQQYAGAEAPVFAVSAISSSRVNFTFSLQHFFLRQCSAAPLPHSRRGAF